MMPALLDPKAIAGNWSLTQAGGEPCTLTLTLDRIEGSGGHAVSLGACAQTPALKGVTNWRVSNDGLSLARADRSTALFLAKHGDDLFKAAGDAGTWTLTPAP